MFTTDYQVILEDITKAFGAIDLRHYCLGVTNDIESAARDRRFASFGNDFISWEIDDWDVFVKASNALKGSLTVLPDTATPPCTVYVFRRTAYSVPPIII